MCAARSSWPAQGHPRQAELALLVVPVGVEERRLADQELRHVVQPQLVEVVAADHHQDVGLGPGSASRGTRSILLTHSSANGGRSAPVACSPGSRTGGGSRRSPRRCWPWRPPQCVGLDGSGRSTTGVAVDGAGRRPCRSGGAAPRRAGRAARPRGPAGRSRAAARPAGRGRPARAADPGAVERQPCARAPARGRGRSPRTAAGAGRAGPPRRRSGSARGSAGPGPCAPGGRGRGRTCRPRGCAVRRPARARPSRRRRSGSSSTSVEDVVQVARRSPR